jgi:hypothetical protein
MLASMPSERPNNITYDYDWLGNQTVWNDDAHAFYERSLGTSDASRRDLLNGTDLGGSAGGHRPAALYFASNVDHMGGANNPAIDRGGYLEVEYGESGNVLSMTVRAQCHDTTTTTCDDPGGTSESARASSLQTTAIASSSAATTPRTQPPRTHPYVQPRAHLTRRHWSMKSGGRFGRGCIPRGVDARYAYANDQEASTQALAFPRHRRAPHRARCSRL